MNRFFAENASDNETLLSVDGCSTSSPSPHQLSFHANLDRLQWLSYLLVFLLPTLLHRPSAAQPFPSYFSLLSPFDFLVQ